VPKLVWRVKLVAELEAGETTEVEVARLERDEQTGLADLGLGLAEAKQLMAAIQAEIVPAQVTIAGEHRRTCVACGRVLASKGYYTATFRSLFGDVPVRVRRLLVCPCQGMGEAKSVAAFALEAATVAPELAYVTARYAALAPFGKVADLLSEVLPISGAPNAGTVRNRTMRIGEAVVPPQVATTAEPALARPAEPVVVGLDGGYVRSRHRQDERHFEVIAGKVIGAEGNQFRFAFAPNSPAIASDAFKQALAMAGVTADTPATVLCEATPGCGGCNARHCRTPQSCWIGGMQRYASNTRCRRPAVLSRPTSTWPPRRFADWSVRCGACGMGVGQDVGANSRLVPLGAAYIFTQPGNRHRASGTPRRRVAGLPRTEPGSTGPLRPPASEWQTDLDRLREEFGQRDHRQAHEQEAADALEQSDGATVPRRANSGANPNFLLSTQPNR
jgi:hypothetical protein